VVVNRDAGRAAQAAALAGPCGRVGLGTDLRGCDVVINATPVGMAGAHEADLPAPADTLRPGQLVVDLVYNPLETRWLATARALGLEAHSGLSMLVFQAAHAFGHWTGMAAPVEVMSAAAREAVLAGPREAGLSGPRDGGTPATFPTDH
jgi:shikimate dehydrogenase